MTGVRVPLEPPALRWRCAVANALPVAECDASDTRSRFLSLFERGIP
jgi:hypothetical protein